MKLKTQNGKQLTFVTALVVLVLILMLNCTQSPVASGGGSGTGVGNGVVIMGKVLGVDSLPVANALVRLRTDMYLADTSGIVSSRCNDTLSTVYTNSAGFFHIDSVRHAKNYYIEVLGTRENYVDSGTMYKVPVPNDTLADTIRLPTRVVAPVKALKGSLIVNGLPQNAYVQIFGMERVSRTDSSGKFTIDHLPVGECERNECEYKIRILVVNNDKTITVHNSELEIKFDNNQNVIDVELELEDDENGDDDDDD